MAKTSDITDLEVAKAIIAIQKAKIANYEALISGLKKALAIVNTMIDTAEDFQIHKSPNNSPDNSHNPIMSD